MSNATKIMICTECNIYNSDQYWLLDGICVTTCPDGRFKGMNSTLHTCMHCSSNCNTCVTTSVTCTSCGQLGGLQSYMYTDHVCYVTCPTNTYA